MDLVNFMANNSVSYHYVVDNDGSVYDCVDTDYGSWSVLDPGNTYTINLVFAGSTIKWSRQEWLDNMGNGMDIAAWLCVQDCAKYGIPTQILVGPNYPQIVNGAGITDHYAFTVNHVPPESTHTDVGPNFPWDVFQASINKYEGNDPLSDPNVVQMIQDIHTEMFKNGPSRSFLATDGSLLDTQLGFLYNVDANAWNNLLTWAYLFDVEYAVQLVESVAANGPAAGSYAANTPFVSQFGQNYCKGLVAFKKKLKAALAQAPASPPVSTS